MAALTNQPLLTSRDNRRKLSVYKSLREWRSWQRHGAFAQIGRLVKLADTQDLGSCAERRRGSSPRAAIAKTAKFSLMNTTDQWLNGVEASVTLLEIAIDARPASLTCFQTSRDKRRARKQSIRLSERLGNLPAPFAS